ncbi:carboxylate-amine ligase [Symbioplanes lichenis]|uniref:carboxylate-amine ligase n=1 Tax=Symbioplanes lichenis TaxID=1629072 RepID=UPI002738F9F3|nr:glutamate--cysteine ligase [Actinoplanes lichenis]
MTRSSAPVPFAAPTLGGSAAPTAGDSVAPTLGDFVAPTLGVEEEYLLLDPDTGRNTALADKVVAGLPDAVRAQSRQEFRGSMLEMVTPVCPGLDELRREITLIRSAAAESAAAAGALLTPIGATPVADPDRDPPDNARFRTITRHYGPIGADAAVCGCHVHVGVPDREAAIRACRGLRPWLPVIQAIAANSPFYQGTDTNHASWRSMQLRRWPLLGPTPPFRSGADFDRAVAEYAAGGAILDETMILWYARPSATWPTVEIRVADVCLTAADTVLVAGLVRALVVTILASDADAGDVPDHALEAAHASAARNGLDGMLLDARTGTARPAWDVVDDLTAYASKALHQLGDDSTVREELARVRSEGTGAARQRRIFTAKADLLTTLREVSA